jgi:hypothetical protein
MLRAFPTGKDLNMTKTKTMRAQEMQELEKQYLQRGGKITIVPTKPSETRPAMKYDPPIWYRGKHTSLPAHQIPNPSLEEGRAYPWLTGSPYRED